MLYRKIGNGNFCRQDYIGREEVGFDVAQRYVCDKLCKSSLSGCALEDHIGRHWEAQDGVHPLPIMHILSTSMRQYRLGLRVDGWILQCAALHCIRAWGRP